MHLAIAFESLFSVPPDHVKSFVCNTLELLVPVAGIKKWASKFYDLRSDIAHGKRIEKSRYQYGPHGHLNHAEYARRVFAFCARARLELLGLYRRSALTRVIHLQYLEQSLQSNRERLATVQHLAADTELARSPKQQAELRMALHTLNMADSSLTAADIDAFRQVITDLRSRADAGELTGITTEDVDNVMQFLEALMI